MNWVDLGQSALTLIGVLVTAVATVLLWRVTSALAVETRRMAEAAARPQIIVTVEPNSWSQIHADLRIANHGNAPAFDICVAFDPPLLPDRENAQGEQQPPFQDLSILRPGQVMTSWIGRFFPFIDRTYKVTASWSRTPDGERETLTYRLAVSDYKNTSSLGSGDPTVEIARRIRKIQEDVHGVFAGSRRINVDVYDTTDRDEHEEAIRAAWSEQDVPDLSQEERRI